MTFRPAARARLTLRSHAAPQGWAVGLAVAGGGMVLASLLLRSSPLAPLIGLAGVAAVLPMLWATRPGPYTVIDRGKGRLEQRNALGLVQKCTTFQRIERVTCDHVTLPAQTPDGADLVIYRAVLITSDGARLPVRGFGAPGPARELKQTIERWMTADAAPEAAE